MGYSGPTGPMPVLACLPEDWWDPAWQAMQSPGVTVSARGMWEALWPERNGHAPPIGHVTNGVHVGTWLDPGLVTLLREADADGVVDIRQNNTSQLAGFAKRDDLAFILETVGIGYLEEKRTYARETDDAGNPTERIEDKSAYHLMDAERYVVSWLRRPRSRAAGKPAGSLPRPSTVLAPGLTMPGRGDAPFLADLDH